MADVQILRAQAGIKEVDQIGWVTVAEIPASSFTAGDKYLILAPALASYSGTADELKLRLVKGDGSYRSTVSGDSPLHYYYMDESSGNLTDNGSAAQTLTKVGTTQVYSQPTLVPSLPSATSISFNYTASTYFQNTSATLPNTGNGSWTVEFWAKVPADNNSTCEFTGWGTNTGNNSATIRLIGGRLALTNPTQGDLYLSPTGTDYSDGSAHHYVVTYNGTTLTGYIDGVATGTTADPTSGLDITGSTLRIGGGYTTWFNGSIDEVSYYSSALSASTALAHYNAGVGSQFTDQYEADEVLSNKVVGVGFMAVYTQPSPAVPVFLQASTSTYAQETRVKKVDLIAINLDDIGTQSTDYWYAEDTTDHALTTTPVDGASVTFTPNGTDKYLYIAQATWTPNDNSIEQTYIDLLYDGTGMRRVSEEGEDASSNEQRNRLLMWANTPTNASHTVKVQGSMEAGTTSTLISSRVIAINLAKFAESHVAVGSDYRLAAFDTWESALSTSFTPSATRDYVVLAHGAGDFGSNQNPDTSWRLMGNPDGNGTRNLTGLRKAYDTFTGGTNVALPSHTPESGTWASRWTQSAGTSWRRSGLGYARQDGGLDDVAESVTNLTVQVADGYVDFEFRVANDGGGVHVRHNGGTTKSTDNSYLLRPISGTGTLYRVSSGSQTSLGTVAGSGNWYRFYFSGDNPTTLKVFRATTRAGLDDEMYLAQAGTLGILETSDSTPANQRVSGEVGLWGFYDAFGADAGAEFDNLEVVEHPFIGNAPDGGAWDASDESTYTLTEVLPFTSGASRSMSLDMRMSETLAGTKDAILAPMIVAFSKELAGSTALGYVSQAVTEAAVKSSAPPASVAQGVIESVVGAANRNALVSQGVIEVAVQSLTVVEGSFTADAYIQKTTSGAFTADAYILATVGGSFTSDAHIANTFSGTFTADAEIGAAATTYPGSFTADAIIEPAHWSTWSATWSMDVQTGQIGNFTADAYIKRTFSGSLTADAYIQKTTQGSLTADAHISTTAAGTFTADAEIQNTYAGTFTADANILAVSSGSFTADAHISKTVEQAFTADAFIFNTVSGSFTADANIVNSVSGSFTADAHISKTVAGSFTADANITNTVAGTFTADADILLTTSGTFTADAYITRSSSGTFTADAHIAKTTEGTFTADATVQATIAGAVTADAYIATTAAGSFTADATIAKTTPGSFTVDAIIDPANWSAWSDTWSMDVQGGVFGNFTADAHIARTFESSFSANAFIQKTFSGSVTADAFIQQVYAGAFTADADIKQTYAGSFTADAEILRTWAGAFTADATIQKTTEQSFVADAHISSTVAGTFTADAYILTEGTVEGSFTADANISATVESSFTADANIAKTIAGNFTADAIIQQTVAGAFTADGHIASTIAGAFTADAVIKQTYAGSFTADAEILVVQPGSFTADAEVLRIWQETFTADAHIKKTIASTFTADAIVSKTYGGTFVADAVIDVASWTDWSATWSMDVTEGAITYPGTFTADAHVKREFTGSFSADAYVKQTYQSTVTADAHIAATIAGSFTADAEIAVTGTVTGDFTADAYVQNTLSGSFSADAYVKQTTAGTFTADAVVAVTYPGSFVADANIAATVAASFTADAWIAVEGTVAGNFTADAFIKNTLSGSFTADADIQRIYAGNFTADAFIRNTFSNTFAAHANIKATLAAAFTADAYVQQTTSAAVTADAYILATASGSFSVDAHLQATVAGSFTASAYITNPSATKRINSSTDVRGTLGSSRDKATLGTSTDKVAVGIDMTVIGTISTKTGTSRSLKSRLEKP